MIEQIYEFAVRKRDVNVKLARLITNVELLGGVVYDCQVVYKPAQLGYMIFVNYEKLDGDAKYEKEIQND